MIETISTLLADLFWLPFRQHILHIFCGLDLAAVGGINGKKLCPTSGKLYDGADGCDRLIMLLIIFNLQWINRILPGLALLNNIKAFKIAYSIK